MITELRAVLEAANLDPDVRALTMIGSERSFTSGADPTLFHRDLDRAPETAARLVDAFHGMLRSVRAMPKPVIARLSGSVVVGGLGLALACDLCVMADNARLISAYSKIGTNPDAGTTWSLTHHLGRRRSLEVMWLNDPIGAQEALSLGLVNRVVPQSRLESETLAVAKRIADGPPGTTGRIKSLVDQACVSDLAAQLDREKAEFVAAAGSREFREGITASFEKRPAQF